MANPKALAPIDDLRMALKAKVAKKASFSDEDWAVFEQRWQPRTFAKEETLIQAGQVEQWFYFIHQGVTRGYFLHNCADVSVGFAYNGDFLSAIDSWISRKPTGFFLECLSEVHTLRISYQDLQAMYDRFKFAERWGRLLMEELLWGMMMREISVLTFSAEERYDRLLGNSPHILQLVPQKHLASYLGMTPETFSRIRKKRSSS